MIIAELELGMKLHSHGVIRKIVKLTDTTIGVTPYREIMLEWTGDGFGGSYERTYYAPMSQRVDVA